MVNKPWYQLTLLILILVIFGIGFYLLNFKVVSPANNNNKSKIISFNIAPAELKDGWLMYKIGAKAVLAGRNLRSAAFYCAPTGTEIIDAKLMGMMKKVSSGNTEQWELPLPINIMATSCYVEGVSPTGEKIKSEEIPNVGYEE